MVLPSSLKKRTAPIALVQALVCTVGVRMILMAKKAEIDSDENSKVLNLEAVRVSENKINEISSPDSERDEWFNTSEAAAYLKVSVATLRNDTSNGKIPFYKFGRRNRYLRSELRQLLLSNRRGLLNGY